MMRPLLIALTTTLLSANAFMATAIEEDARRERATSGGEVATYRASWGVLKRAGTATLTTTRDTIDGDTVVHAVLVVRGGVPGARVNERLESWMNLSTMASHQFLQRTRYPGFTRDRLRKFDASHRRWVGHTNAKPDSGRLPSSRPIDDLSAVFLARSLSLDVGSEVTLNDYWRPESNPVVLQVLRQETITVPAGTYETLVIRPIIRTSSLFADQGEAEIYVSTGPHRELVMLKAKLAIGTLVLALER
jgi:hypothetical protein